MDKSTKQYSFKMHEPPSKNASPTVYFYVKSISSIATYGFLTKWTWNFHQYIDLSHKIISVVLSIVCLSAVYRFKSTMTKWRGIVTIFNVIVTLSLCGYYGVKWWFLFDYFGFVCKILGAVFGYLCFGNTVKLMGVIGR
mmetsp:Transcript_11687/g.24659  ORF Transcript_11687/g.24659 Transcript_11687/m.24659 type:complete len:139 (+) Transcript_11687:294-710(+)